MVWSNLTCYLNEYESGHSSWCENLIICLAKEGVDYTLKCGCMMQLVQMWGHFNSFVSVKASIHKCTRQQRCRPSVSCRFKAWVKVKRESRFLVLIQAAPMGITAMRQHGHCREQILTELSSSTGSLVWGDDNSHYVLQAPLPHSGELCSQKSS